MKIKRKRPKGRPEYQIQCSVAQWLDAHPLLRGRWTHFPAGGYRGTKTAVWLKRFGTKPGVPDVLIFAPCLDRDGNLYSSCAIELKKNGNWRLSGSQKHWLGTLRATGWLVAATQGDEDPLSLLESLYPLDAPLPLLPGLPREDRLLQARQLQADWPELPARKLAKLTRLSLATVHALSSEETTALPTEVEPPPPPKLDTLLSKRRAVKRWLLQRKWRRATDWQLSKWAGVKVVEVIVQRAWNAGRGGKRLNSGATPQSLSLRQTLLRSD